MNFYEILKTKKLGRGSPDYWTQLFAEHVGGKGEWKVAGVLPLTFTAKGGTAVDWVIEGNDDNGTENLVSPIRTANGWKHGYRNYINGDYVPSYTNGEWLYDVYIPINSASFTFWATNVPNPSSTFYFFDSDKQYLPNTAKGTNNYNNIIISNISPDAAYMQFAFRTYCMSEQEIIDNNYQVMLVKGSTAPDHYIPYQQGVGERTENLFDCRKNYHGETDNTVAGVRFLYGNQSITLSQTANGVYPQQQISGEDGILTLAKNTQYYGKLYIDNAPENANIYMLLQASTDGSRYTTIATIRSAGVTFTPNDDYTVYRWLFVAEGDGLTYNNTVVKFAIVEGSTAPDNYIPYGYQIPLTISQQGQPDKTYDIYIGDSPLTSGDYADYESGKIYKAKRIHEDTVTIDGIKWDILDYDHDEVYKADGTRAKHTVTIQTHDIINNLQYSARQAAFAFPDGLAAGTYHFTIGAHPWVAGDVNKVLTFTLANAIQSGGQLVFDGAYNQTLVGTTISAFASPTSTIVAETVTMTEGSTGTDLGTILRSKTDTVNSIDRALLGSNNWLESALRQYLNSDKTAGSVWVPQTAFDRPPTWATTTAGFLNDKSANFISHIGTAKKITALNTVADGGGTVESDEKFFLLSRSEVYGGNEATGGEGTAYSYYSDYSDLSGAGGGADTNRIKYRNGAAQYWWLRSPNATSAYYVRPVGTTGGVYNINAGYSYGVAPACCIVLDDMDDWVKQTFYTEVDADLPALETFKGENVVSTTLYNKPTMEIKYK